MPSKKDNSKSKKSKKEKNDSKQFIQDIKELEAIEAIEDEVDGLMKQPILNSEEKEKFEDVNKRYLPNLFK